MTVEHCTRKVDSMEQRDYNGNCLKSFNPPILNQKQPQQQQSLQYDNDSVIERFYHGKNILITGATGFLGKVLLWKLLESCRGCGQIYVLLRSKKGVPAEKRLMQMLKVKPFDKYQHDDLIQQVVAIDSDVTKPGLGLSQPDRKLLQEEINVVFHVAASVSFDAPLKDNIRDNVIGTKNILQLCKEMLHLKSMIHVSTAYSNCNHRNINEDLHPLERNPDDVVELANRLSDESIDSMTHQLLEGRPNTYTYTKAMAEHLVSREIGILPIGIIRPSIVTPAAEEPTQGWVDNINGLAGLGTLASLGLLRAMDWDYWAISDVVPVDYCANAIIVAGHSVATKKVDKLPIYNMTSGNLNPISWGALFVLLREQAMLHPSTKVIRPIIVPPKYKKINTITFNLTKIFSELFFAYFVDMIISLLGYKTLLVHMTKKMHHGYRILKPFTTQGWNFNSDNVIELINSMTPSDRKKFNFDLRQIDWKVQADRIWHGVRTNILKENNDMQSYKEGEKRLRLVTHTHNLGIFIMFCSVVMLGFMIMRLF